MHPKSGIAGARARGGEKAWQVLCGQNVRSHGRKWGYLLG